MYHIKQDRRAASSVELISRAVLQIMKEKPFSKITITDVQRVSTVSRSTFYRNFDQLEDVLELLCDQGFQAAFSDMEADSIPVSVFRYWSNHNDILEALVEIHRTDILYASFRRSALRLESLRAFAGDPRQYDYLVSMITSVMIGVLVTWTEHGRRESQDEVLRLVKNSFAALSRFRLL